MEPFDNVTQMPRANGATSDQGVPRFNVKSLSLFDETGHLTVTFWLLCAAVVVAIYLVIEALTVEEPRLPVTPIVDATPSLNHKEPAKKPVQKVEATDASNK